MGYLYDSLVPIGKFHSEPTLQEIIENYVPVDIDPYTGAIIVTSHPEGFHGWMSDTSNDPVSDFGDMQSDLYKNLFM